MRLFAAALAASLALAACTPPEADRPRLPTPAEDDLLRPLARGARTGDFSEVLDYLAARSGDPHGSWDVYLAEVESGRRAAAAPRGTLAPAPPCSPAVYPVLRPGAATLSSSWSELEPRFAALSADVRALRPAAGAPSKALRGAGLPRSLFDPPWRAVGEAGSVTVVPAALRFVSGRAIVADQVELVFEGLPKDALFVTRGAAAPTAVRAAPEPQAPLAGRPGVVSAALGAGAAYVGSESPGWGRFDMVWGENGLAALTVSQSSPVLFAPTPRPLKEAWFLRSEADLLLVRRGRDYAEAICLTPRSVSSVVLAERRFDGFEGGPASGARSTRWRRPFP